MDGMKKGILAARRIPTSSTAGTVQSASTCLFTAGFLFDVTKTIVGSAASLAIAGAGVGYKAYKFCQSKEMEK